VGAFGHHHLDDASGRKQASEGMASRFGQSGAMACLDCVIGDMGDAPYEYRSLVRLRTEPFEMEHGMNEDDDNLYFAVGIVIVLMFLVGIFGAIGPFISDWILK
jgi:hypothetical protein